MAIRLVPVDYDPFAESHVTFTPVDYDPFDVAQVAARARAAGTAPAPDPRDVAAEQRRQAYNRGEREAPLPTPEVNRALGRIGAGHEQTGDEAMVYARQHEPERRATFESNADAANPDVRNTMAYISTRLHQLNPQQYPWLFRDGHPLTSQEIGELVMHKSDEIAGMSPQDATNYLFGRPEMRPANVAASLGQTRAPPTIQDPLQIRLQSRRERTGPNDYSGTEFPTAPEPVPDTWTERATKFLHRTGDLFSQTFNGVLMREAEYHDGPASYSAAGDQAFDSRGNELYHTVQSEGQRLVVESQQALDTPGRRAFEAATADLNRNAYNYSGGTDSYLTQTAESLVQMLPVIAAGIVTRGRSLEAEAEVAPGSLLGRMARGFGNEARENRGSLGTLYEQQAGQQYGQSRAAGRTPEAANVDSMIYGLAEAIPEALPMGSLMQPGGSFLPRLLRTSGFEGASEGMTQIVEDLYQKAVITPDMTWGQVKSDVLQAMGLGAGLGAGMHIVEAPFHRPGEMPPPTSPPGVEPGIREAAAASPPNITPEDHASPLPTELIAEGKKAVDDALATTQADQVIGDNIGHQVGDNVAVTIGDQTRTGKIEDAFTEEDPETGTHHGAVIGWHDGTRTRERFSDLHDAGARIERSQPRVRDTGNRVAPDIVEYLMRNGIPEHVAHGIAAGISAESANNHGIRNATSGATGLGQWLGPRLAELRRRYGPNPSRQQQLEFLVYELRGGDPGGRAVLQSRNPGEALDNYIRHFMRPAAGAETTGDLERGRSALQGAGVGGEGEYAATDEATPGPDFGWTHRPVDQAGAPTTEAAPSAPFTGLASSEPALSEPVSDGVVRNAEPSTNLSEAETLAAQGGGARDAPLHLSAVEGADAASSEGVSDRRVRNAEASRDLRDIQPALDKGFGALDVPTQTRVLAGVLRRTENPEIFRAVIQAVPVDVMNVLAGENGSPDHLRRDRAMFIDALTSDHALPIRADAINAIIHSPAFSIAEGVPADGIRGRPSEQSAAGVASEGDRQNASPLVGQDAIEPASTQSIGDGTREAPISVTSAEDMARAGENVNVEPTPAQAEAGVYRKAHIQLHGLNITIENPKGSSRRGTDEHGQPWETHLDQAAYGYVKRTEGADGEQADVYIGDHPASGRVFVVDQFDPKTRKFDETKSVLGANNRAEALAIYDHGFSDGSGPQRRRGVTEMSVDGFRNFLKEPHDSPVAGSQHDIETFNAEPHVQAMRDYVANSTGSLNDTEKMGKALGLTSEQTHRVMGALAARSDSGIRMTKGRPAGVRRVLVSPAQTKLVGRKQVTTRAARYKTVIYRPAVPARFQRTSVRQAPLHFMEWVRAQGGVKSDRHDLRNVGGIARHPGVISKTGLSLDQLGERMVEAGWATERPSESDVLEMLTMGSTARVYRPEDSHALVEAKNAEPDHEAILRGLADEFGLEISDDDISRAAEYVSQGKAPIQALTEAANDAAVNALEAGASETGNDAFLDVPEAAHGGVQQGTEATGDQRPAEAVARPESQPQDAQERAGANEKSDQAGEAAGKVESRAGAGDQAGADNSSPASQPSDAAATTVTGPQPETQPDMLGTQPGDERRALERKGEGRKQSEATQKAPGSEGGLFDNTAKQADLTQPESSGPVEKAKAALQSALDALNGKTPEAPVAEAAPAETPEAEPKPQVEQEQPRYQRRLNEGDDPDSGEAALSESFGDQASMDAEILRDTLESPTFSTEGFGGLDIPTQRMVLHSVFAVAQNSKIFDAIVELIPVDVVNILAEKQLTPEMLLHDEAMLQNLPATLGNDNDAIASGVDAASAFVEAAAFSAAKDAATFAAHDVTNPALDFDAAMGAIGDRQDDTPSSDVEQGADGVTASSAPLSVEQTEAVAKRLQAELARLGIADRITLKVANGLLESAQGSYLRRVIKVSLDMAINPDATLSHESIHAMRALGLFTTSEWSALKNQALADAGIKEFLRKGGYATLSDEARAEEAVAEFYARWRSERMQAKGFGAKAFRRLVDFVHALGRAVAWVKGQAPGAGTALRNIESGKIGARETGAGLDGASRAPVNETQGAALFQERTPASIWNDQLNYARDLSGATKTPGKWDKFAAAFDRFRINFQDRVLPLLRTQTAIERTIGRPLTEEEQPYRQEALYTGRVGDQFEKMADNIVEPMFEAMKENNVTSDELESYLYARHAPERNAKLAKEGVEDGSGMSDIEAAAILSRIEKAGKIEALKNVAEWFDKLNSFAMDTRVSGETMSQEQANAWKDVYKNYAPLRGHRELPEEERPNMGQSGFSVKGPESRRAFGRKSLADDIVAHAIVQAQEAVVRAEKNRVATELYNLAKANPDPNFWQIQKVTMKKRVNPDTGMVETYPVTQATAEDMPYTVNLKVNGKAQRVTFNRHNPAAVRAAEAMRRMNEPENVFAVLQHVNQWLSRVNTMLSPDFIWRNALRDMETATANLSQFDMKGLRTDVIASYLKALAAAERAAFKRGGDSEWDQAMRDYSANGGKISFNQIESVDQLKKDIANRFSRIQASNLSPKEAGLKVWDGLKWTFQKIEQVNQGVENATRLSVYKNLVDRGVSKKQAAFIAKEITVNFNRRGVYGALVNSAYLFANASTQGSARMILALRHRRVQKIAGSMIVAGAVVAMMNAAMGGNDDDGVPYYDKIAEWEKANNLIFMIPGSGGRYIKIPMAYGYNIFPDLGRQLVDVFRGHTHPMDAAGNWLGNAANSFNPISGRESLANFIAPTVVDPLVDLYVDNRDFAGRPIMPDQSAFGPPIPDSQRFWPSVPPYYRDLTDTLNRVTGGDQVVPGWIDVSPETLDYLTQQAFGSAGATIERLGSTVMKTVRQDPDNPLELNDIPVVRTMVGQKPSWYDKAAFYARLNHITETVQRAREYRRNLDREGQHAYVAENRDVVELHRVATAAQREMRDIRKTRAHADILLQQGRMTQDRYNEVRARMHVREERLFARFNHIYLAHVSEPLSIDR